MTAEFMIEIHLSASQVADTIRRTLETAASRGSRSMHAAADLVIGKQRETTRRSTQGPPNRPTPASCVEESHDLIRSAP